MKSIYHRENQNKISALGNALTYPFTVFQLLRNGQSFKDEEIDLAMECLREAQAILQGLKKYDLQLEFNNTKREEAYVT